MLTDRLLFRRYVFQKKEKKRSQMDAPEMEEIVSQKIWYACLFK